FDRADQKCSRRHEDHTALILKCRVDGGLDGGRVEGPAVACGAEIANVENIGAAVGRRGDPNRRSDRGGVGPDDGAKREPSTPGKRSGRWHGQARTFTELSVAPLAKATGLPA